MADDDLKEQVILFDGVCNLCSGSVKFIITRDPNRIFKFSPLQSTFGQKTLKDLGLSSDSLETFILIDQGKFYLRSDAALRVAKKLNGLWPVFYVFIILPKPFRDWVYGVVAKNRYKWFGKKEECMIPSQEDLERFVQ